MTSYQEISKLLAGIDGLIAKEHDIDRRYALFAARDHITIAFRYLNNDDNDRAGIHLDAARWILKGVHA